MKGLYKFIGRISGLHSESSGQRGKGAAFIPLLTFALVACLAASAGAQITGTVFRDYNGDGVKQAGEPGREGIVVKAYSNAAPPAKDALLTQTTTDNNGNYSLSPASYPVRLEYSIPSGFCNLDPEQDFPAPLANTYGSEVQFADGPGVHNFVINYPADFAIDPNPQVFVPCYVNGDPLPPGTSGDADAFVRFNYLDNGHGANSGYDGVNGGPYGDPHDLVGIGRQVGTVWGVAYSRQAKKVFTSAFLKRHAGMGPMGPGGIYMIDANSFSPAANYQWLNFDTDLNIPTHNSGGPFVANPMNGSNTVYFSPTVGSNSARGLPTDKTQPSRDAAAWEQVGKVSFGDCDISEDGKFLYVVNLYDRKLYSIDLENPHSPVKPTAADVGTKVKGFQIPNPCGLIAGAGEYRPFACKYVRGKVYIGVICSGQAQNGTIVGTANDMYAYVYEFDVATNTFNPNAILSFPLDYRAGTSNPWEPWSPTFSNCFECQGYPMLSDIEFDSEGNMILGMMDRRGHQAGWYNYDLNGSGNVAIATVGDILRCVRNKNNPDCEYSISFNPEYYKDDKYHAEPTLGGLAVHRTSDFDNILSGYMDPVWIWSGGVMRFDNKTGEKIGDGYEVYYNVAGGATGPFGKANGIGDLEVVGEEPPIEVGNRLWFDTDRDGIQDGGEIGIAGVTVQLRSADGSQVLGTTTTAADGTYYFFLGNVPDGDPVTPGAQQGVQPFTNYKIYVPASQFATGAPLKNALLTSANEVGNGADDRSDSDGMWVGGDVVIMFATTDRGENNHSLDIGFQPADYGDLPNTYGTTNAGNGPWHTITSQLKLGNCVDAEIDGAASGMANGDDANPAGLVATIPQSSYPCDDEDGVSFTTPMIPGSQACVTVNVMNSTGADAVLQAWVDFNGDGQFQTGEQLTTVDFAPAGKTVPNGGLTNAKLCFDVPANATFQGGMAMVRFRLSPTGGLSPLGDGGLGEVEDYKLPLAKVGTLVWNDYNNDGIQNEAASAGINGVNVSLTWLGPDGQVAGGDDVVYTSATALMTGTDGTYMFIGLTPGMYKIAPVTPPGYLDGREDLGGNDVRDGDDHDGVMVAINNPINLLTGENGTGDNPGGTNGFPDNQDNLSFDFNYIAVDYGDLPNTYGTTTGSNGPAHVVNPNLKLGVTVDGDPDGQPDAMAGAMAGGDDNDADGDDEDGITLSGPMIPGSAACFIVNAMNMTGAPAVLQAWVDFNGDGQMQPTEQITTGDFAPNGATVPNGGLNNAKLCFTVPANATFEGGNAFMRFRLSQAGGLNATGALANNVIPSGEVEDYKVSLAKVGTFVWNDYNNDGQQNEPATAGINGVGIQLTWLGPNGTVGGGDDVNFTTSTSTMGNEGNYMFIGLTPGMYKLSVSSVPPSFSPTLLNNGSDVTDADDPTGVMVQIPDPVNLPTGENGTGDNPGGTNGFPDNQDDLTYDFGYIQRDYGDLPDTYGTTTGSNGPSHVVNPSLKLGACVDAENNGNPEPMAGAMTGGDDNTNGANVDGTSSTCGDDEDGVVFITPMIPGYEACVKVNAMNATGAAAVLQAWIDFNGDGQFQAAEQVSTGNFAPNGANVPAGGLTDAVLCFTVPQTATFQGGQAMVRFRLSPTGGLTPNGADGPGEVEDYKVALAKIGNLVWTDYNFDGQQNEPASAGINGATVQLEYAGADNDLSTAGDNKVYSVVSATMNGTPGMYMFYGLITGVYEVSIPTAPNGAIPTKLNIGNDVTDSDDPAGYTITVPNPIALPTGENGTGDNPGGTNGFPDAQDNLTIDFGYVGFDYGDLPNTYGTTIATEGPKHIVTPDLYLGACVDSEEDAFPDPMAGLMGAGDDGNTGTGTQGNCAVAGDDENGIQFLTPFIPGWRACLGVTVKNSTGEPAKLQAWVDFNGNGQFEITEQLNSLDFTGNGLDVPAAGLNNARVCFNIPANATFQGGQAMLRFRLSPNGGLPTGNPNGATPTLGEVEDYKLPLSKIGNFVWWDYDFDGQQDPNEPGINNSALKLTWYGQDGVVGGGDDEEYTTLTSIMNGQSGMYMFQGLIPGMYKLVLTNTPAGFTPTKLNLGSDVTDSDDPTGVMVSIPDPINLITGENGTGDNPGGTNGFPDNQDDLTYDFGFVAFDYGDLPNTYGTTKNTGGPVHRLFPGLFLGTCIDGETDGQPANGSAQDDQVITEAVLGTCGTGDDENGIVSFETPLVPGYQACIRATVTNTTGSPAVMQMWLDYNGDGVFDTDEECLTGAFAPIGAVIPNGGITNQQLCFDVPPTATLNGGNIAIRIRLSPSGGLDSKGPIDLLQAPVGEVEDYSLPVAKIGNYVWNDYNNNGQQDEPGTAGLNNITVQVTWAGTDLAFGTSDDRSYITVTAPEAAVNGKYNLCGLIPGSYKVSIPNFPPNFIQTQLGVGAEVSDADDASGEMVMIPMPIALPTGENATGDDPGTNNNFPDAQDNLQIDFGLITRDFGDLPDTYGTTDPNTPDGPVHVVNPNLYLGTCQDGELDGQPNPMAGAMNGGDDNNTGSAVDGTLSTCGDDEDGIVFETPLIPGYQACIRVTAKNTLTSAAVLQMWVDWNGDGDVADAGEQVTTQSFTNTGATVPVGGLTNAQLCFDVPATATFAGGQAMVRFRLSPNGGLTPNGPENMPFPVGETEDYKVPVTKLGNLVWNDNNNDGIQNEAGTNGLNNVTVQLVWAGPDGNLATTGDNRTYTTVTSTMNGTNGMYMFWGVTPGTYSVSVPTNPPAFIPTQLNIGSDVTDADNPAGVTLVIPNPPAMPVNENGIGDMPGGFNNYPDNQDDLTIDFGYISVDYGDLPNTYGTTIASDGPRHVINPILKLGASVDGELNGQPEAMAGLMTGGDDGNNGLYNEGGAGDDENGVVFEAPVIPGFQSCIRVTTMNNTGTNAVLQAWIDWNGDGDVTDAGEQLNTGAFAAAAPGAIVPNGTTTNQLCFDVPATATFQGGQAFVRFRVSPTGGQSFNGPTAMPYPIGEVEDYKLPLAKVGNYVWIDANVNGIQDENGILGINNVTVNLNWAGPDGNFNTTIDNKLYTDVTVQENGINGKYTFCGLIPGNYNLVVPPFGYVPTLLIDVNGNTQDVIDSDNPAGVAFNIPNPINLITGENGTGDNPGQINGFPDNQDNLTFDFGYLGFDYGDLPNTYGTTDANNGAVHTVHPDLYLGPCVDIDLDGQPEAMAGFMTGGDDGNTGPGRLGTCTPLADDENGVTFVTPLIPGYEACIEVTARNATGGSAILQGWIDFNGNGTFEAAEQLTSGNFAPAGATVPNGGLTNARLCFTVPANASFTGGNLFSRFRLSLTGGQVATGPALTSGNIPRGEVEDHKSPLALIGNYVWMDNPDIEGDQDLTEMALANVGINLTWAGFDGTLGTADDRTYTTNTDANGKYEFRGLIPNSNYRLLPVKYTAPNGVAGASINPQNKILTIPNLAPANDNNDSDANPGINVSIPNLTTNLLPTAENGVSDNNGANGFPDNQENLSLDLGFIDEPKIAASMAIMGFEMTTCGKFGVIMDLCIKNASTAPLANLQAVLNLAGADAYGLAFQGLLGAPQIVSSTAQQNPTLNGAYSGASSGAGANLLNGTSGLLFPGDQVCIRLRFEVDPDLPGAPSNPKAQASVSGKAQNFQGVPIPDYWNGGQQYVANDLSDDGTDPMSTNPGFPGDTGGANDPTPLTNCWQITQPLVANDLSNASMNDECELLVLSGMVLEGEIEACSEEVYPLGGFYKVTVKNAQNQVLPNPLPANYLNQTVIVEVQHIMTCNKTWGTLKLEDKIKPEVVCSDIHVNCAVTNYEPAYLANTLGFANAFPEITDCSDYTVNHVDTWNDLACGEGFNNVPDLSAYVVRKWQVTDEWGNSNSCIQHIYFHRLHVDDVLLPADITVSCSVNNTTPSATGAPYVNDLGQTWVLWPGQGFCEMSVTFEDLEIPVCDGTYKIERKWRIHDWCLPTNAVGPQFNPNYYIQIITVMDNEGPAIACPADLTVTTDPFTCCATTNLPDAIIVDHCSRVNNISGMVIGFDYYTGEQIGMFTIGGDLVSFPGNNEWEPDTLGAWGFTPCLPRGTHTVVYAAQDDCGNTNTCSFRLTVADGIPPVAACDEWTQVALTNNGEAFIDATTFDDGSYDNCAQVHFKVRRMDANSCQETDGFFDQAKFCCSDVNDTLTVILRVYDVDVPAGKVALDFEEAHANDCMVQVLVEDKIKPVCLAPANVTVSCENFDPTLWAYGIPQISDNCCLDDTKVYQGQIGLTHTTNISLFDTVCNKGTITRTFRAFDCYGQSTSCTQRVFVRYEQDYFVKFPDDQVVTVCDGTGNYGEPVIFGEDCELIGISFEDEVFTVVPDACYKIERTWKIINWCTYNPNLPSIYVPNPEPNPNSSAAQNRLGVTVSAAGTPAPWDPTVRAILPGQPATNYSIYYDPNANCYIYKQIIKIIDTNKPVIENCPASPVEFCDITPNDPELWNAMYWWDQVIASHDLCEGPVDLTITATDSCSGSNVNIEYLLFLDLDGNGSMETVVSSTNLPGYNTVLYNNINSQNYALGETRAFDFRPVPANQKYGFAIQETVSGTKKTASVRWNTFASQNSYSIPELPYGTHKIKWFVTDGCGNNSECEYTFVVKDCKKPTVVCVNGLSSNVGPTGVCPTLWVTDFLLYTVDNCTPSDQLVVGIRKSGTGSGFPVDAQGNPIREVSYGCPEAGTTQYVEIWSIDKAGNADFCETYVIIQDNANVCNTGPSAQVAGLLSTEATNGVEEGLVDINGFSNAIPTFTYTTMSNDQGSYNFNAVPTASNSTITPTKDDNPLNGVSTFDLVLINKHILGIELLDSPYKMIAADANKNGSITATDIIEFRKLILGLYNELPANTSWRFVDKDFAFPNTSNPFQTQFPENKAIANLTTDALAQDFVSIKVGDVNGSAVANSLMGSDDRSFGTFTFDVQERNVKAGESFDVTFTPADNVQGYQFTMNLTGLEVLGLEGMKDGNYAVFADGLTFSVDGQDAQQAFTIRMRATRAARLSQLMSVSSRITKAEAYRNGERQDVAFRFNSADGATVTGVGFELYQNQPNPWVNKTTIAFHLPEASTATLSIYDETGRVLWQQKAAYAKGYHSVLIDRSLQTDNGVMYYRLETDKHSAAKKMIQTK